MEILAPAGNMKALKSAVAGGADAVYIGAGDFNARSKAENFGKDELRLAVSYCHDRGVRVYLTLNTLVKAKESESAIRVAREASEAGVDAFIVQDLILAEKLQQLFPDMPLHASTQMGIHNAFGAAFAKKAGFDRVIFSRDTLPEDMLRAKRETGIETECFVHGAHCVSFSGNCYFSALVSGYSGNRGKCLQLCRKKYTLSCGSRKKTGYMLSAKDLCLIEDLPLLKKSGIDSLKIEGRLRSPEYVYTVTSAYKKAESGAVPPMKDIQTVFNRGDYSHAYVRNDRPDIIYEVTQNNIGSYAGKITSCKGGEITARGLKAKSGDGFKILRKGKEVGSAVYRGKFIISGSVLPGDELRLTKSHDIELQVDSAIIKSDKRLIHNEYSKISRKNNSSMSDIVYNSYTLPEKCMILRADENTDKKLFLLADAIIWAPLQYDADELDKAAKSINKPLILELPVEARGRDCDILCEIVKRNIFDGYVANNVYALEMIAGRPVLFGGELNILSTTETPCIASQEAAEADGKDVVTILGREIMMNLTHCPARQLGYACGKCVHDGMSLTDENRNTMPLRRRKLSYCYFELLNSKIRNISDKIDRNKYGRLLVDARNVNCERALLALKDPYRLRFDEKTETRGRWGKGVK